LILSRSPPPSATITPGRLLALTDHRAAQGDEPAIDIEIDAHRGARLDRGRGRHEHGPVARIEELDPLGVTGQMKLEPDRTHAATVDHSDRKRDRLTQLLARRSPPSVRAASEASETVCNPVSE